MSDTHVPPTLPGGGDPFRVEPVSPAAYPGALDTSSAPAGGGPGMPATSPRRAGKTAAIVAGAVLVVGGAAGGGYLVTSAVGGGGPQPEEALPATAMLFAKVDLNPSVSQKVGALRFASKFPSAPAETRSQDGDIKKALVESLQKQGQLSGVDYATDIQPWLGDRAGLAVLPAGTTGSQPGTAGSQPGVVVALAVTDAAKARTGLAKLTAQSSATKCSVETDWAVCSDSQATLDAALAATKQESLAASAVFVADQKSLDSDGVAAFWMNLPPLLKASQADTASGDLADSVKNAGRVFGAVRFDGASLELVAKSMGAQPLTTSPMHGTTVGDLPADTVAAVGFAGLGGMMKQQWSTMESAGGQSFTSGLDQLRAQTGLDLPNDLYTVLSPHLTVAFGGGDLQKGESPKVAALSDAAPDTVRGVLDAAAKAFSTSLGLEVVDNKGHSLVASTPEYADAIRAGSGLGASPAFTAAVPDAKDATVVAYADIAKLIQLYGTDLPQSQRDNLAPLSSVGLSVVVNERSNGLRLRLTTK